MNNRDTVVQAILAAMEEFNEGQPDGERVVVSSEAELFGNSTGLTSMGLVNVITLVEEQLSDRLDEEVILADDRAFAQELNPFRSVQSLADYIMQFRDDTATR